MWAAAIGAVISAIPSIMKAIDGGDQVAQAEKGLSTLSRPEYETPKEIGIAGQLSKAAFADPTMVGQSALQDRIDQQMSNSIGASVEAGNPLANLVALQAQSQRATQDLGIAASQQNEKDRAAYQNMLQVISQYKDREFQMNEFAPYLDKYREYRDVLGAGKKNVHGASDDLSSIGVNMLGTFMNQQTSTGNGSGIDSQGVNTAVQNYYQTPMPNSNSNGLSSMYSDNPMYYE